MRFITGTRGGACAAALALVVVATPTIAQEPESGTIQALALGDLQTLEEKYTSLLEAMPDDKLDWTPAEGVRSPRAVFGHVAGANYFFSTFLGAEIPEDVRTRYTSGAAYESIQDRAELLEVLRSSFDHMRSVAQTLSDSTLDESVTVFGQSTNRRGALLMMLTHNHEHLGQSIAYARANGVTPPWSGGGN